MRTKARLAIILLTLCVLVGSCATLDLRMGDLSEFIKNMNDKDRVALAMAVYSDLWDTYKGLHQHYTEMYPDGMPDAIRQDFFDRKKYLQRIEPMIALYDTMINSGEPIDPGLRTKIIVFLETSYVKHGGK